MRKLLIGLSLLVALGVACYLVLDINLNNIFISDVKQIEVTASIDKRNLTALINKHLKESNNNENLDYNIYLKDKIEVRGSYIVWNDYSASLLLKFNPSVVQGDIVLKLDELAVGGVKLPIETVLQYVKDKFKLPEYVAVNPGGRTVHVAVTKIKQKNGFKIRAKEFNLEKDRISFLLIDPKP